MLKIRTALEPIETRMVEGGRNHWNLLGKAFGGWLVTVSGVSVLFGVRARRIKLVPRARERAELCRAHGCTRAHPHERSRAFLDPVSRRA
jgi:hypothetical protein